MEVKQIQAKIKKYNEKLSSTRKQADNLAACIQNLQKLEPTPEYERKEDGTLKKDKVVRWMLPNRQFSNKEMTTEEHDKCVKDCCAEAESIKFK